VSEIAVGLAAQGLSIYETLRRSLGQSVAEQKGSTNGHVDSDEDAGIS
jgi:hypothetical protein